MEVEFHQIYQGETFYYMDKQYGRVSLPDEEDNAFRLEDGEPRWFASDTIVERR